LAIGQLQLHHWPQAKNMKLGFGELPITGGNPTGTYFLTENWPLMEEILHFSRHRAVARAQIWNAPLDFSLFGRNVWCKTPKISTLATTEFGGLGIRALNGYSGVLSLLVALPCPVLYDIRLFSISKLHAGSRGLARERRYDIIGWPVSWSGTVWGSRIVLECDYRKHCHYISQSIAIAILQVPWYALNVRRPSFHHYQIVSASLF
jgi:hypothetical protein